MTEIDFRLRSSFDRDRLSTEIDFRLRLSFNFSTLARSIATFKTFRLVFKGFPKVSILKWLEKLFCSNLSNDLFSVKYSTLFVMKAYPVIRFSIFLGIFLA